VWCAMRNGRLSLMWDGGFGGVFVGIASLRLACIDCCADRLSDGVVLVQFIMKAGSWLCLGRHE
jgi:hypothetical protein